MSKYVYSSAAELPTATHHERYARGQRSGLAEMSRAGLPVPPGFTIATDVCNVYFKNNNRVRTKSRRKLTRATLKLEKLMGQKLGDAAKPVAAQRSVGREVLHAGMMNTILNLGLNDVTTSARCQERQRAFRL